MRKKVFILAHNYGMQFVESCNQYAHLFDTSQYEVTAAYLTGKPDDAIIEKTYVEKILFLDCQRRDIRGLKIPAIKKLLALCQLEQFDIVIAHRYKPTYIMLWVAQFYKIPKLFFVMHAIGTMQFFTRKMFTRLLFKKNMIFAGVSSAVRDDMRKDMWRIPLNHIITLPNIIDYQAYEPELYSRMEARAKLHIPQDAFIFGHIGRFVKDKDQKTLVSAFHQIKLRCPNGKLTLIGDGKLEDTLRQQVTELGLDNDVIFTGYIHDGFRYMKAFDVFILPSIKEAFGRVLLEAMIARTPIIATKTHGIPEVVGKEGFLVEPANANALAKAMLEVYHLPPAELSKHSEKAYQHLRQRFSNDAFKELFWKTFQSKEMAI